MSREQPPMSIDALARPHLRETGPQVLLNLGLVVALGVLATISLFIAASPYSAAQSAASLTDTDPEIRMAHHERDPPARESYWAFLSAPHWAFAAPRCRVYYAIR